ncbi:MBL fold metallo-hydrolase [Brevibacillus sp. 179-C9.3 HS]|uniref:MBL fold metallo-hydrolase n=1 Tax=unclassified Brevibacillus TaxID=2684853 RepID=UPI0039A1C396
MGPVYGFVLERAGEQTLYVAGDTIWCGEVEQAIAEYHPGVIVVFAGAARFLTGDPITMTKEDIAHVAVAAPESRILVAQGLLTLSKNRLIHHLTNENQRNKLFLRK